MTGAKNANGAKIVILTLCLGAVVGIVLWLFLRVVSLGSSLIWNVIPQKTGLSWIVVPLCAFGGCAAGLVRKKYGDYPEELKVVMRKVKREKHYDYSNMLVMLICALLPLVFGASVGPEAGLTGIIAALCYWVGDNVSFAKQNAALFSQLGEAITLGQIFHSPLFGILSVEEDPGEDGKPPALPKLQKLALYGLSAVAGFLVIAGLNRLFHTSMEGFPSFSHASIHAGDYALIIPYILIGLLLCLIFEKAEKLLGAVSAHVPAVLRETLCGAVIGFVGMFAPLLLFSGEEQMSHIMEFFGDYSPWVLIGVCFLKLILTAFCLRFGMKGGHFFPLIFACVCLGHGLAMLIFPAVADHAAFAACVITSATLGAQLKKPLAVTLFMLLCFPLRLIIWIFTAAAVGARVMQLMEKKDSFPAESK